MRDWTAALEKAFAAGAFSHRADWVYIRNFPTPAVKDFMLLRPLRREMSLAEWGENIHRLNTWLSERGLFGYVKTLKCPGFAVNIGAAVFFTKREPPPAVLVALLLEAPTMGWEVVQ